MGASWGGDLVSQYIIVTACFHQGTHYLDLVCSLCLLKLVFIKFVWYLLFLFRAEDYKYFFFQSALCYSYVFLFGITKKCKWWN
jgi:hypothetical protein